LQLRATPDELVTPVPAPQERGTEGLAVRLARHHAIRFLLRVPAASLALAVEPAQELQARSPVILPAGELAPRPQAPAGLSLDSRLHHPQAVLCHRFPAALEVVELARLLKAWEASRFPATAPHLEWPSVKRVA
jgi:hypothetical protein